MRKQSVFWRILAVLSNTHFVEPLLRYQNTFVFDEISFKTSRMIQIYIYNRILVLRINIWSTLRPEIPYSIVKIGSFSPISRKLAEASHTSPFEPRIYLEGFSNPINSFKPFPGHFEQFLKKSIFWSRTCPDSDRRGSHQFPKTVFPNIQARYLKTVFNIRQIKV